jgi:uncharacterized protein (DUF58 family)
MLVAAAICVLVAYGTGIQQLLYVGAFLLVLVVAAFLAVAARRPRVAVTRTFSPHVIEAGSPTAVTLLVRNLSASRSAPGRWADALPWHPGATPEADLPRLAARGPRFASRGNTRELEYDLTPPQRGWFQVGPLSLSVGDAFGLATSRAQVGGTSSLVVTPEVIPLAETGLSVPAGDGEARMVQRRATGDADDSMTREYRRGDALRRVHWRATARRGDLMVRQEEQRSLPQARVIVDTMRAGYRDADSDAAGDTDESVSFEWVVRMLASVTVHLRRGGFQVSIEESGRRQLGELARDRRRTWGDEEFLVTLSRFHLVDDRAEHVDIVKDAGNRGPIVALLGTPDDELVDTLVDRRKYGDVAVAFMVRGLSPLDELDRSFGTPTRAPFVAERLADAGWIVVPVHPYDDPAMAWEAVVIETGRARA